MVQRPAYLILRALPVGVWKTERIVGTCRMGQGWLRRRSLPKGRPRTSRPRAILSPKWFYVNCLGVGETAYSTQEVFYSGNHPDNFLELSSLVDSGGLIPGQYDENPLAGLPNAAQV